MHNTPFTTVRDILRFAVTRFNTEGLAFGHGSADALDEAAGRLLEDRGRFPAGDEHAIRPHRHAVE